jgi:hypothetical protein
MRGWPTAICGRIRTVIGQGGRTPSSNPDQQKQRKKTPHGGLLATACLLRIVALGGFGNVLFKLGDPGISM